MLVHAKEMNNLKYSRVQSSIIWLVHSDLIYFQSSVWLCNIMHAIKCVRIKALVGIEDPGLPNIPKAKSRFYTKMEQMKF